jgi:shikimate dehydrogenase
MGRTLLGVAGAPVAHSRSPAMQNAALAELGLDWLYVPLPLSPERFPAAAAVLGDSGFKGINVTVPHKVAAHEVATEHSPAAAAIGAANTLTYGEGGIAADNTDAGGFIDALGEDPRGWRAVVLGAGGSARAVVWALREAGADVAVWNRTPERARDLARDFEVEAVERPGGCDLLVNCTAVGLAPGGDAEGDLGLAGIEPPRVVVDLVYGEHRTPVQAWAETGTARFVDGLEVLVRQGARSLERWTGLPAPVETMRAAAVRAP